MYIHYTVYISLILCIYNNIFLIQQHLHIHTHRRFYVRFTFNMLMFFFFNCL